MAIMRAAYVYLFRTSIIATLLLLIETQTQNTSSSDMSEAVIPNTTFLFDDKLELVTKKFTLAHVAEEILTPPPLMTATATWVMEELTIIEHPPPRVHYVTVFDEVGTKNSSLLEKAMLIESKICGDACTVYPTDYSTPRWDKCEACRCDDKCTKYRDCCPFVKLQHGVTYDTGEVYTSCLSAYPIPIPGFEELLFPEEFQNVVSKCPRSTGPHTEVTGEESKLINGATDHVQDPTISKCENPKLTDPDQVLFVSSETSGLTYRNRYCAGCHKDTEQLIVWGTVMYCRNTSPSFLSQVTTKEELYRLLLTPEEVLKTNCYLKYTMPSFFKYRRTCSVQIQDLISECNVSGIVQVLDPRIEEACGLYTSIFDHKYKNIFCFLCNNEYPWPLELLRMYVQWGYPSNSARVSFSALVDFDDDDSSQSFSDDNVGSAASAADCLPYEYFDSLKCDCRVPVCSEGKYLTSNGSCVSLVTSNMLGYRVCSQLHIQTQSQILLEDIINFHWDLRMHKQTLSHSLLKIFATNWCPGSNALDLAVDESLSKQGTLNDLERDIDITVNQTVLAVQQFWQLLVNFNVSFTNACFNESKPLNICSTNSSVYVQSEEFHAFAFDGQKYIHHIQYLYTSRCPFIALGKRNFTVSAESEDQLVFEATKKLIPRSQVDEISESEVRLCVSDYLSLTDTGPQVCKRTNTDFDTWTISGLISIVCTCISLLCLFLTFITYTIFPSLRSGGGKNIMVLIVTLFTAQAFYEFAIEQFENRTACKAFGLIIHYTWLAAIFSMNACTIERFYKLCFPLQARVTFSSNKPFLWATAYTLFCPLVIVGINVVVNLFVKEEDIGYGSPRLCYINTITSRIWAFAFPMGLVVVVNICLMIITVCKLRQMSGPDRKSSSHNKLGLVACARLSIVTGLTWLLTFLYEAVPWSGFSYVFTALIGLQGLLFFVSMILNKRVFGLYSQRFSCWRKKWNYSMSDDSFKHASEQNGVVNNSKPSNISTLSSHIASDGGSFINAER